MGKSLEVIPYPHIVLPDPLPKNYKFKCEHEHCGKLFVKLSRLRTHENTHKNEKPYRCSYEGCNCAYYRPNHLKRHEATTHSKLGGDHMCTFDGCKASFGSSQSLYFHEKRKHNVKKYKCSHCIEMFSKKFLMKEHEASHTGKKPFQCFRKDCGKAFDTHANFKTHQKSHRKESLDSNDLNNNPHSTTSYKCTRCDEIFSKWTDMVNHRKTHPHPDREKVPCPECQKIFSKSSLREHKKVHEDGNENTAFFCPHEDCPRFYYQVKNLTHHIRHKHEGISYECTVCSKKLSSKQKLSNHIKKIHENPQSPKRSKQIKEPAFCREKILKMLSGEKDLTLKRRGPPKGFKPNPRKWPEVEELAEIKSNDGPTKINSKHEDMQTDEDLTDSGLSLEINTASQPTLKRKSENCL